MKDIAHGGIKYPLEYSLDENKVREFVSVKVSEYNVEPVNASVYRNEGKLIYTNHVPGKQVNVEPTVLNILDKIKILGIEMILLLKLIFKILTQSIQGILLKSVIQF